MFRDYTAGKVLVFWDLKDFPVPEGRRIGEIVGSALTREGYKGEVLITAYGESPEDNLDSEITFVHRSEFPSLLLNKILIDFAMAASNIPLPHLEPLTLMVVAQNIKEDTEFVYLLQEVKASDFNVFLVVPDLWHPEEVSLPVVSFAWRWTSLLEGGDPMPKT